MKKTNVKLWGYLREYFAITLGAMFVAIAVKIIASFNLSFGGVTGISIIIQELIGIPLNVTYFGLSVALLLIGGLKKGWDFLVKTLYATIIISFVFIPLTSGFPEVSSHILLAAFCSAALLGLGVGIILKNGGSTSGPDSVAFFLKEKIPEKYTMLIIDSIVFITGIFVFGLNNIYSIVVLLVTPFVVGKVINFKKSTPPINPNAVGVEINISNETFNDILPAGAT